MINLTLIQLDIPSHQCKVRKYFRFRSLINPNSGY